MERPRVTVELKGQWPMTGHIDMRMYVLPSNSWATQKQKRTKFNLPIFLIPGNRPQPSQTTKRQSILFRRSRQLD